MDITRYAFNTERGFSHIVAEGQSIGKGDLVYIDEDGYLCTEFTDKRIKVFVGNANEGKNAGEILSVNYYLFQYENKEGRYNFVMSDVGGYMYTKHTYMSDGAECTQNIYVGLILALRDKWITVEPLMRPDRAIKDADLFGGM